MKAFYFIRTPLQYINSIELKNEKYSEVDNSSLILLCDYKKSLIQFKQIVNPNDWDEVIYLWSSFSKMSDYSILNLLLTFFRKKRLDKIINKVQSSDIVVWGNLSSNWCHYYLKKNKSDYPVTVVDDGFATINLIDKINKGKSLLYHKGFLNKMENFILKPKNKIQFNELSFFSVFKIQNPEIKIELNNYNFWKSKNENITSIFKKVYFVGQPLVFQNILSKKQYSNLLNNIFSFYTKKGYECYYLPHRSCVLDYLDPNWKVIKNELPLEFMMINNRNEIPCVFATFYSTAVYNLSRLFDKNQVFFHYWNIDNHELFINHSKNVFNYLELNSLERQQIYLTSRLN